MMEKRKTSKKAALWLIVGVAAVCGIGSALLGGGDETPDPAATTPGTSVEAPARPATEEPAAPSVSREQRAAVEKARQYLRLGGFSRTGLVKQLEFEGFPADVATAAADSLGVDWNEQAAKKAAQYDRLGGISRRGLIEQLEFEGFTHKQAVYGAEAIGY